MAYNVTKSSPWVYFVNELKALFSKDPEVHVQYTDGAYEVILRVDNCIKAEALSKLLPLKLVFGNVDFLVKVIPANIKESSMSDIFNAAFAGNPAFYAFTHNATTRYNYALFSDEPVQFYGDNLASPLGLETRLLEDIAKDVLQGATDVFISTKPMDVVCKNGES